MTRTSAALTAVAISALLLTGCGAKSEPTKEAKSDRTGTTSTAASSKQAAGRLTDLQSIGQLRTLFNASADHPRLIVLASPT